MNLGPVGISPWGGERQECSWKKVLGDLTSKGADAEDLKLLAVWARVETNTFFMKAKSGKVMPPAPSPLPLPLAVAQGAKGGLQTHQHPPQPLPAVSTSQGFAPSGLYSSILPVLLKFSKATQSQDPKSEVTQPVLLLYSASLLSNQRAKDIAVLQGCIKHEGDNHKKCMRCWERVFSA